MRYICRVQVKVDVIYDAIITVGGIVKMPSIEKRPNILYDES